MGEVISNDLNFLQMSDTATVTGPLHGDYLKSDTFDQASMVWSPCGVEGALNINEQIRLTSTNKNASGYLFFDNGINLTLLTKRFQWKRCTVGKK